MFYSLNNLKVLDYVSKPVEYVIYTYIPEQNYRVRKYYNDIITQKNIGLTAAKKMVKLLLNIEYFQNFFIKLLSLKSFLKSNYIIFLRTRHFLENKIMN